MREIVTVQVGEFANFIGSHFWNFQDELLGLAEDSYADPIYKNSSLNMDILYRPGETQQGLLTYTPRLVSINFQGSLGSLRSCGSLYNGIPTSDPSQVLTWSGKVSTRVSEPLEKNLFLQSLYEEVECGDQKRNGSAKPIEEKDRVECLENAVHYWTDYSKVHYHPQSLYEINGLWTSFEEFNNYGTGCEVFRENSRGEEISDRLRFFIEECDHVQGVQFLVDDSGGFSSVAADILEYISDEYSNIPVLLYSARSSEAHLNIRSWKESISRSLHDAISFTRLSSLCKLMVPIGLPFLSLSKACSSLRIDDSKAYHCSAIYASAFHSSTLPFRMESLGPSTNPSNTIGALDVNELVRMIGGQGRQNTVSILDVAMPAPPLNGGGEQGYLQGNLHSLTPEVEEDVEDPAAVDAIIIHGAFHSGGSRASVTEVQNSVYNGYQRNNTSGSLFSHLSASLCPLPIPLPFPSIFGNRIDQHGKILHEPIPGSDKRGSLDVHSLPMAARFRSSCAIRPFIEKRLQNLNKFGINRGAPGLGLLGDWGFGKEEVDEMGEALSKMLMALYPSSQYSSDSDDI